MGANVGAIASAVGGTTVTLSHVGQVFRPSRKNMIRWRGWMRHIVRDQAVVWMICCFIGMALPCMMSVEFIRNAPVSGIRVAGMTAEGIDHRYPGYGLWILMLVVSFLRLGTPAKSCRVTPSPDAGATSSGRPVPGLVALASKE